MAALLATLGLTDAKTQELEKQGTTTSSNASPTRNQAHNLTHNQTYFEKVAADIVAASPIFGKARVPIIASHRDKESLMCEIVDLKKTLVDTEIHLHMHKQLYLKALEESRKLEREVEELELRGNYDAPRTGGVTRLESKFKGLGVQIDVLEDIVAERKYGELSLLRKDLGATHTRETEVERDTIATEILRLKIYLKHMRLLTEEAQEDNNNLNFCRRQSARLAIENPRVRQAVEAQKVSIQRARDEIGRLKKEGEDNLNRMKLLAKEEKKFEKQLEDLKPKAQAARHEMDKVSRKNNQLAYDRMIFNQDFRRDHPGIVLA